MKALELQGVYLQRGNFLLQNINLSIEKGDTVALTGRSGAGKSTLIGLIGNAVAADAGIIRYFGKEMYEAETTIRGQLSVVYDQPNFNTEFRAKRLAQEIRRFEKAYDLERFEQYMEQLGLDGKKRVKHFSKGSMKKFMLILALCRGPQLLVMDEPTSELDENSGEEIWTLISEYRKQQELTILFSSHNKEEIQGLGARTVRLENGGLVS